MDDKEYLQDLALIFESAEPEQDGEVSFIRFEANTAKEIAYVLRRVANKLQSMVH